jgi:hypothetical protein
MTRLDILGDENLCPEHSLCIINFVGVFLEMCPLGQFSESSNVALGSRRVTWLTNFTER